MWSDWWQQTVKQMPCAGGGQPGLACLPLTAVTSCPLWCVLNAISVPFESVMLSNRRSNAARVDAGSFACVHALIDKAGNIMWDSRCVLLHIQLAGAIRSSTMAGQLCAVALLSATETAHLGKRRLEALVQRAYKRCALEAAE